MRRTWLLVPLVLAVLLAAAAVWYGRGSSEATGGSGNGGMSLGVSDIDLGTCDDLGNPTTCDLALGRTFSLSVVIDSPPAGGYITVLSYVTHGADLTYQGVRAVDDVNPAKDCQQLLVDNGEPPTPAGTLSTACAGGSLQIPHVDKFTGTYVTHRLRCSDSESSTLVQLVPSGDPPAGNYGSGFAGASGMELFPMSDSVTIHCTGAVITTTPTQTATHTLTPTPTVTPTKAAEPVDGDGDGCSDQRENGPDPKLGGLRDYTNPYDFFDVNGDRQITVPYDILQIILVYNKGPLDPGGPGAMYSPEKDRGMPVAGPLYAWQRTGPDGHVDVPNDILPDILQYNHDCR